MAESLHVDNLELWQELVSKHVIEGECSKFSSGGFYADVSASRPSDVWFSRIGSMSHRFKRTAKHIRRSNQEFFSLHLQLKGTAVQSQDGREIMLRPGEAACNDTSRPFEVRFSDSYERLVVLMPRALVESVLGPTQRLTSLKIGSDSPLGSVLVPFLSNVSRVLDKVSPEAAGKLSQTAMSLIVTTLAEQLSLDLSQMNCSRGALLFRAEEFIRTNSWNSDLTPQMVAAALNISLRYLQNLFQENERTPSEYIWQCRLRNCQRDLGNPCLSSLSIGDIAIRGGFSGFAHFSRRFKDAYGMSPREFRAIAESQQAGPLPFLDPSAAGSETEGTVRAVLQTANGATRERSLP